MAVIGTFNPALITDRDWVRAQVGDTNEGAWLLDDATYDALLIGATSRTHAAVTACDLMLARLAHEASSVEDANLKLTFTGRIAAVGEVRQRLAAAITATATTATAAVSGGIDTQAVW